MKLLRATAYKITYMIPKGALKGERHSVLIESDEFSSLNDVTVAWPEITDHLRLPVTTPLIAVEAMRLWKDRSP